MVILPVQVSVYEDQRVNIFHLKRDMIKAVLAGQEETLQSRYDSLARGVVHDFMSSVVNPVRYIEDEEVLPDSLRFNFFRLVNCLTDGEMNRLEEKKLSSGIIRIDGRKQKQWKAANEAHSFPFIQQFSEILDCRYLAVLKIAGQDDLEDHKTENLVGGMTYETMIIDCKTVGVH
jgi:hypothetical protein